MKLFDFNEHIVFFYFWRTERIQSGIWKNDRNLPEKEFEAVQAAVTEKRLCSAWH